MPSDSATDARFLTAAEFTAIMRYRDRRDALTALRRHGARLTKLGNRWLIERAELERVLAAAAVPPEPQA